MMQKLLFLTFFIFFIASPEAFAQPADTDDKDGDGCEGSSQWLYERCKGPCDKTLAIGLRACETGMGTARKPTAEEANRCRADMQRANDLCMMKCTQALERNLAYCAGDDNV